MNQPVPPSTLSGAIRLAIHDLELIRDDKRYAVSMGKWHGRNGGGDFTGPCYVCFAGAVMAKTLNLSTEDSVLHLGHVPSEWRAIFCALDNVRQGLVEQAVDEWQDGWKIEYDLAPDFNADVPEYNSDYPDEFIFHMKELASKLEAAGT